MAREKTTESQSYDVGFELGYDMYRYGFPINEVSHDKAAHEGFLAAQKMASQVKGDIYDRKQAQIRSRAYFKKGIDVSISANDIKEALIKTGESCPVTQIPFTYATGSDTDWSVDRIDNESGYHPSNIIIMSARANEAKGDLSLIDIMKFVVSSDITRIYKSYNKATLLTTEQWMRMFLIFYNRMPKSVFNEKAKDLVSDERTSHALFNFFMAQLAASASGSVKEFEKAFTASPVFGFYIKSAIIKRQDLLSLRKRIKKHMASYYDSNKYDTNAARITRSVNHMVDKLHEEKRFSGLVRALASDVIGGGERYLAITKELVRIQFKSYGTIKHY